MTLSDLRKLTVRKQVRIRFRIANGMDCVINEHGVAQVPELRRIADFNLEQELAGASQFQWEPVAPPDAKTVPLSRAIGREELAAMTDSAPSAAAHDHDHDDE